MIAFLSLENVNGVSIKAVLLLISVEKLGMEDYSREEFSSCVRTMQIHWVRVLFVCLFCCFFLYPCHHVITTDLSKAFFFYHMRSNIQSTCLEYWFFAVPSYHAALSSLDYERLRRDDDAWMTSELSCARKQKQRLSQEEQSASDLFQFDDAFLCSSFSMLVLIYDFLPSGLFLLLFCIVLNRLEAIFESFLKNDS